MSIGIEAFSLFEKRHNVKLQEKYPYLVVANVAVHPDEFNPNRDYLHFKNTNTSPSSPFHFLSLIPDETSSDMDTSILFQVVNLLHFINWACYFHKKLKDDYDKINDFPSKHTREEEKAFSKSLLEIIQEFTPDRKSSDAEITADSKRRMSKNGTIIKPSKFIQVCRFYARAWFEENFEAKQSIKFAYYVSKYIESNPLSDEQKQKCPRYKSNSRSKEEVKNLFTDVELHNAVNNVLENINSYRWREQKCNMVQPYYMNIALPYSTKINFNLYRFSIILEKSFNSAGLPYYTISIMQLGCKHNFYKFARLHLERYTSIF